MTQSGHFRWAANEGEVVVELTKPCSMTQRHVDMFAGESLDNPLA
jgi:hypothetical protein